MGLTPPPPPAIADIVEAPGLPAGDGEELITAPAPPSHTAPTGVGGDVDTAQAPQSPMSVEALPSPVTDNGAAGDASDHDVDTTLAAKEEVMKTMLYWR